MGFEDVAAAVLITAAGSGSRMGSGSPKQFELICGEPVLLKSLRTFVQTLPGASIFITLPEEYLRTGNNLLRDGLPAGVFRLCHTVAGGATRQESVRHGLEALLDIDPAYVLIHDAARPWVTGAQIETCLSCAVTHGAAAPVIPLRDTVKEVGKDGAIIQHHDRSRLFGIQTPQTFRYRTILEAHRRARREGVRCTDDTEIYGRYAGKVFTIPGDEKNIKITYSSDLENMRAGDRIMVTGFGYDIHPLVERRPLVLGGVTIPFHKGEAGYSDGDAALHALIDGILGAAVMGDIGTHFPPGNPAYDGISSLVLLRKTLDLIHEKGYFLDHADITIVIENPKIGPYKDQIRNRIAETAKIPAESVSVKAKTKEGFPPVGTGEAVESYASVQLIRRKW